MSDCYNQCGAYSREGFAGAHSLSRRQVDREIESGRLIARKVGKRTLIFPEDRIAWMNALPKVVPTKDSDRESTEDDTT